MNKPTQHAKNAKHPHHPHPTDAPVWFITGCFTGFGQELAKQAIEGGYRTVGGDCPRPGQAAELCCE
ncbi:hypothetical protein [Undibacterium sp. GrIS 1.8]|uniref:hypothetical protein n=1 Tax=Undibacterium sp. GrIS 1.8 TaxID=3143934 RepID=UPI00339713E2